jgi:transposase
VPAAAPAAPREPAADTSESKAPTEAPAAPKGRRTLKIRTAKLYTPSQKAEILEHAGDYGVTEASKKFKVSRYSIYGWQRKVSNAATGNGPSPTAGPAPQEIEAQRDKEILDEWHRHPGLGPSQIRNQLRRKGIRTSVNTVRRVMVGAGYRPPKVERKVHDQRYEATRPNHLWHLDFVQRNIHRANTFTLIIIDDFSRYVVGHGVDECGERADFVIAAFEEAVARHGRPEMVMSDKGAAFWSWKGVSRFTALLTELGIDHLEAEHKEWNGKVEVFNANLHKELFDAHRFYDLAEMRRRLAAHLHWYNHARTHHALGACSSPPTGTTGASTRSSRASRRAPGGTRATCSTSASGAWSSSRSRARAVWPRCGSWASASWSCQRAPDPDRARRRGGELASPPRSEHRAGEGAVGSEDVAPARSRATPHHGGYRGGDVAHGSGPASPPPAAIASRARKCDHPTACFAASSGTRPLCSIATSVARPCGTRRTTRRVAPGGIAAFPASPQAISMRCGRSSRTKCPRMITPLISTANRPPGRASRRAKSPIQRTSRSGRTK